MSFTKKIKFFKFIISLFYSMIIYAQSNVSIRQTSNQLISPLDATKTILLSVGALTRQITPESTKKQNDKIDSFIELSHNIANQNPDVDIIAFFFFDSDHLPNDDRSSEYTQKLTMLIKTYPQIKIYNIDLKEFKEQIPGIDDSQLIEELSSDAALLKDLVLPFVQQHAGGSQVSIIQMPKTCLDLSAEQKIVLPKQFLAQKVCDILKIPSVLHPSLEVSPACLSETSQWGSNFLALPHLNLLLTGLSKTPSDSALKFLTQLSYQNPSQNIITLDTSKTASESINDYFNIVKIDPSTHPGKCSYALLKASPALAQRLLIEGSEKYLSSLDVDHMERFISGAESSPEQAYFNLLIEMLKRDLEYNKQIEEIQRRNEKKILAQIKIKDPSCVPEIIELPVLFDGDRGISKFSNPVGGIFLANSTSGGQYYLASSGFSFIDQYVQETLKKYNINTIFQKSCMQSSGRSESCQAIQLPYRKN